MKMVKSLLLGTAAGLVAMSGAQAADLPVKAKPVQYVKICSLYGAGFYYIPGTDTCIKLGGYMRAEVNFNAGGSFAVPGTSLPSANLASANFNNRNAFFQDWRTRAAITLDTRSQTEYGTLRSYFLISATDDQSTNPGNSGNPNVANGSGASAYSRIFSPTAFIQFAGFTIGKTASFFDFDSNPYSNSSAYVGSAEGGNGVQLVAYTAQLGNGLSASISAENRDGRKMGITNVANNTATTITYANDMMPDLTANLRVDQAWGSAQIMGAVHQVRATDVAGLAGVAANAPGDQTGYALGAGLKVNLPMLGKGDYIQGQVAYSKGGTDYLGANFSGLPQVVSTGGNPITQVGMASTWDAVVVPGNTLDLTTGWGLTVGYEHNWSSSLKTSLWGDYTKVRFSDAASAVIIPGALTAGYAGIGAATAGSSATWSMYQIGSRTVWTPVTNLDLSMEVMYNKLNTGFAGAGYADQSWWSGMVRAQRNFYP